VAAANNAARATTDDPVSLSKYQKRKLQTPTKSKNSQSEKQMILKSPPHTLQVSISMLDTRFNRWAQVIDGRRALGLSCSARGGLWPVTAFHYLICRGVLM
jgi:hypothetical protein